MRDALPARFETAATTRSNRPKPGRRMNRNPMVGNLPDRTGKASPVFPSLRCISRTPPLQPPLLAQRMPGPYGSLLSVSPGLYGSNTRRECDDRHSRHRRGNASDDHRAAAGQYAVRHSRHRRGNASDDHRAAPGQYTMRHSVVMSTEKEMRCPSDWKRRQRSFWIARPVPDAPGAKKQHPSPPRTGRGSRGGAIAPTSRIAEDRACLGSLYATAGDRPTGRARHLRSSHRCGAFRVHRRYNRRSLPNGCLAPTARYCPSRLDSMARTPVGNATTAIPGTVGTTHPMTTVRRQANTPSAIPGTVGATHPTTTARRQANTPSAIPSSCPRNARCVARSIRTGDNDPFASPGPFPTPRGKETAPVPSPDGEGIKGRGDRANVPHCRGPRMFGFALRNGGRQADRMGEASPVFPSLRCISRTPPLQRPLLARRMPCPYSSLLSVSPGPIGRFPELRDTAPLRSGNPRVLTASPPMPARINNSGSAPGSLSTIII